MIGGLLSTETISVFKMSRPTDFQKLQKHFHILQLMKSLRGPFFTFSLSGGGAARTPSTRQFRH